MICTIALYHSQQIWCKAVLENNGTYLRIHLTWLGKHLLGSYGEHSGWNTFENPLNLAVLTFFLGSYGVILDERHYRELLMQHVTPPVAKVYTGILINPSVLLLTLKPILFYKCIFVVQERNSMNPKTAKLFGHGVS